MSEFFREVQEDYRRDQALALWNRYQNWIVAAVFLVIAGTAAWGIYGHFRRQADETAGGRYEAALQLLRKDKSPEAIKSLEAIGRDGPRGYAGLARLVVADQTASHDAAAGIKAYDALVDDATYIESLKKIAQLRAAYLRIDIDAPKQFQQRYAALANSDQPYRNSFRELLALAALKGGDEKAAGNWLTEIVADPSAPDSLRRRANAFLAIVQSGKLPSPAAPSPAAPNSESPSAAAPSSSQPGAASPRPAQPSPKQPAK